MDDIVKEAREALEMSYEFDKDNRAQAQADLQFAAGFQWSDAAKAERAGRPMITINRSSQFLRQVSNPIRQNMPTIKVETDHDDQSGMDDLANSLLRRIQYNSSASHVYAEATEHMVACGIGWFRVVQDYLDQESFDQELLIKRVFNPLSVYPDPASREFDRSDMGWCLVSEEWPKKAFQKKWPKAATTGLDVTGTQPGQSILWGSADTVRVAEHWRRKTKQKRMLQLRTGHVIAADDLPEQVLEQIKPAIVNERSVEAHSVEMVMVSGAEILGDPYECPCRWIPIIPVVGAELPLDRGVYRYGLLRFQREPQQLHNYFLSVAAESLGQQPKAPYIGTAKQIAAYKDMWDNANRRPTNYLLYDHDPQNPGPPQRVPPPPLPTALVQMAQMMDESMKAATGIYDASLGARSNETSGVAIGARVEQGNNSTFHFIDNLEHSLEHLGRVLLDMIPKVYDTERDMKVRSADDSESVVTINKPVYNYNGREQVMNDVSQMKFNSVRVILGPSYASRRAEAVNQLVQLTTAIPMVGEIGGDIIVRNMDFEGAEELAERLKAANPIVQQMQQPQQGADPMAEMQMQGAAQMMNSELESANAKTEQERAKAAQEAAKVQGVQLDNALKVKKLREPPPRPGNGANAGAPDRRMSFN